MIQTKSSKQRLSDSRRIEAIKQRQREQVNRQKQIANSLNTSDTSALKNKKIIFNSDDEEDKKEDTTMSKVKKRSGTQPTLFDSSSDSEEEKYNFEIKSQFEGERGQKLFEMSSAMTDSRFKLDERFKEESDEESTESPDLIGDEENQVDGEVVVEKKKSLEILERVLGIQLPIKPPTKEKRKRLIRYDPENEDAFKFVKKPDPDEEGKSKKKSKKSKVEKPEPTPEPKVSGERYFEIAGDLKELLNNTESTKPFSFGHKFSFQDTQQEDNNDMQWLNGDQEMKESEHFREERSMQSPKSKEGANKRFDSKNFPTEMQMREQTKFFIGPDDPRLSEGVEFFRRTISIEEVREKWLMTRDFVIDTFKKNKRLASKSPKTKSSNHYRKHSQSGQRRFSRK